MSANIEDRANFSSFLPFRPEDTGFPWRQGRTWPGLEVSTPKSISLLLARNRSLEIEARTVLQKLQLGKQSGFLLVGLLKWLGHASNCLIIFSTSASWPFQRFRLLLASDFLQNGSKSRLKAWSLFPDGQTIPKERLLIKSILARQSGSFFQLLGPNFVRVSSSGIFATFPKQPSFLPACPRPSFPRHFQPRLVQSLFFSAIGLASASLRDFSTVF